MCIRDRDWGLYLAVEGVEESFLTRNYGTGYGELYKPDSASMGGGKGNGKDFNMEEMDADAAVNSEDGEISGSKGLFQNRFTATDIFSQLADLSVDEIIDALESAGMDVTIPDTVAVSYTHLDVYKRQEWSNPAGVISCHRTVNT